MRAIRRALYRLGFRPRPGSIFHSPSLHLIYTLRSVDLAAAFRAGLDNPPS